MELSFNYINPRQEKIYREKCIFLEKSFNDVIYRNFTHHPVRFTKAHKPAPKGSLHVFIEKTGCAICRKKAGMRKLRL